MTVGACLVTRGDVSLNPILEAFDQFGFDEVVVWDNNHREDLAVYGRYAAIAETKSDLIYVQDDDVVLRADAIMHLVDLHEPGHVVCNMPQEFRHPFYAEHALVGFGAVFDRDLPEQAWHRFFEGYWDFGIRNPLSPLLLKTDGICHTIDETYARRAHHQASFDAAFARTCDVIFTALTPRILADVPKTNLPWATDSDRMFRQPSHVGERQRMLELALSVRTAA